ncbi:MAG TPA: hypothetical protein PLK90_10630 [Clostridiales bacterium]|nr:hypothetical protein [Clostridiales bacterium]HQP70844.1 hypothetical protein [Clostridiales bacterium]
MKIRQMIILTILVTIFQIYCAGIIYVTPEESGTRDGSSWENAGSAE